MYKYNLYPSTTPSPSFSRRKYDISGGAPIAQTQVPKAACHEPPSTAPKHGLNGMVQLAHCISSWRYTPTSVAELLKSSQTRMDCCADNVNHDAMDNCGRWNANLCTRSAARNFIPKFLTVLDMQGMSEGARFHCNAWDAHELWRTPEGQISAAALEKRWSLPGIDKRGKANSTA